MKSYNERWINAFVSGGRRGESMQAAGVGKQKYYNLKHDPEFMRIVNERRGDIDRGAVMRMETFLTEDVERLKNIIRDEEVKPQVRVNAIQLLLTQFNNYKMLTDIQERIENLEKIAGEQQ